MTMDRLHSMEGYWRRFPPLHILKTWELGYKPAATEEEKKEEAQNNLRALFNQLQSENAEVKKLPQFMIDDLEKVKEINERRRSQN